MYMCLNFAYSEKVVSKTLCGMYLVLVGIVLVVDDSPKRSMTHSRLFLIPHSNWNNLNFHSHLTIAFLFHLVVVGCIFFIVLTFLNHFHTLRIFSCSFSMHFVQLIPPKKKKHTHTFALTYRQMRLKLTANDVVFKHLL